MGNEKDRNGTEQRLLTAVGELIAEKGIESLGVNAIAERAGVSKMLIYRYFGSLDELIGKYIMQHDYWVNVPEIVPPDCNLQVFLKKLFHEQIERLRNDKLLVRLCRWELSASNKIVEQIRQRREENGIKLIEFVTAVSGKPYEQVQVLATLISSSLTYLAMFSETGEIYNGFNLKNNQGWQQLEDGIHTIIDQWGKS